MSGGLIFNEDIAGSVNHKRRRIQEGASQFGASYTRPHTLLGTELRYVTDMGEMSV